MPRFLDRWLGKDAPQLVEKSDTEHLHRYGSMTIIGAPVQESSGKNPESGEAPLTILRLGNERESKLYQAKEIKFDNRQIDRVHFANDLSKSGERQLSIGLPLVQKQGEPAKFAVTIDRKNGKITHLHTSEGVQIEWRDRSGARHIFTGQKDPQGIPIFEAYEKNREGQWEWQTVAIPLSELIITYADQMLVRHQTDEDTVREISARLFFGTEGSGITLSQQQISAQEVSSREPLPQQVREQELREFENEAIESWLDGLRGDREIFLNLLKKHGVRDIPTLQDTFPEDLDDSFTIGIAESRKLAEREDVKHRLKVTLQEVDWAGTPAVYTGEDGSSLPERYFEVFLEEKPDYVLFLWALEGMIKQGESDRQSFSWNAVPQMFGDQQSYETWKKAYYQHKDKLQTLARELDLGNLTDTELMLMALSLRLGTYLKNPYQKGTV